MIAKPAPTPVTRPALFTVANEVLFELQVTVWFVAVEGKMLYISCWVVPVAILAVLGLTETLTTGIVTFILQVSLKLPSIVLAIILVVPANKPVTSPLLSMVATEGRLEVQIIFLFEAVEGETLATSCLIPFTAILSLCRFKVIPVTGTFLTLMLEVALKLPSAVVAVIMAVPADMPVTRPVLLTVAMAGVPELQITTWLAVAGATTAASCFVL